MDRADTRIVAFSYAAHLTERDNAKFRDLIRSDKFQKLWGHRVVLTEDGRVKVANSKTGFKFASSVGGVGTGERGDIVILDDPHNVKEAESEQVLAETVRWFREAMQNRLNSLKDGAIIVIMQRVNSGDVSGAILEFYPEYVHLCIPMEYEPDRHCATPIGWEDPREEEGELAWSERFNHAELRAFKTLPYMWAGQYQQRPEVRGGGILPRTGWEYWDRDLAMRYGRNENQFPDLDYVVGSLDTAFGLKQENDFSAFVALGVWRDMYDRPKVMVMTAWRDRLSLNDLLKKTVQSCRRLKVDRLLIEAKASGMSLAQEMRRLHSEEMWATQLVNPGNADKVARAYSVQHLLGEDVEGQGRREGVVYVPCADGMPRQWAQMLIDECAQFPKGKHDDLVDAAVQGLRHLRDCGFARLVGEVDLETERRMEHKSQKVVPLYPGAQF
jgi:predicted phage terminase large subunit-like protein